MKYHVIVHPQAKDDLWRNARWWAENYSVEQALQWIDTVEIQLQELDTTPQRHGLSLENDDFPYEIRDQLVGLGSRRSYRAIFTIQEDTVHVLVVRRAAQDAVTPDDIRFAPDK